MNFYAPWKLIDELEANNLPSSKQYIINIEKLGIIPKPQNNYFLHRQNNGISAVESRIYTIDEIKRIVDIVRKFKDKK